MSILVNFSKSLLKSSLSKSCYLVRSFSKVTSKSTNSQSNHLTNPKNCSILTILESYNKSPKVPEAPEFSILEQQLSSYKSTDISNIVQIKYLLSQLKNSNTLSSIPQKIFQLVEEWLLNYLKSFNKSELNTLNDILVLYLETGQKNSAFIKTMQISLFNHIDQLELKNIQFLYAVHQKEGILSKEDMTEIVIKPYLKEIVSRFDCTDMSDMSEILINYVQHCKSYGLYLDNNLKDKVENYLMKFQSNEMKALEIVKIHVNLLEFVHVLGFLNSNIASKATKTLIPYFFLAKPEYFIKLGVFFSQFSLETEKFWSYYKKRIDSISQIASNGFQAPFCLTMASLKITDPRVQTQIYRRISEDLQDLVLNSRANRKKIQKIKKNEDKMLMISILEQKNLDFIIDLDDGPNIDIALPTKRLAYKLLEHEDYIWPEGKPNGIKSLECLILSKKNWNVQIISTLETNTKKDRKAFLESIINKNN